MEVLWLIILFSVVGSVVTERTLQFKNSFLEEATVEDVVPDLGGRRRLIVRDLDTDNLSVLWVLKDQKTLLPYVQDPKTKLPYLLQYKGQEDDVKLFRLIRGKDHRFVVPDPDGEDLFRPVVNSKGEVDLSAISEKETGFTLKVNMGCGGGKHGLAEPMFAVRGLELEIAKVSYQYREEIMEL